MIDPHMFENDLDSVNSEESMQSSIQITITITKW